MARFICGKALLVVEREDDYDKRPSYRTHAFIQSASPPGADIHEDLTLADGYCFPVPNQCRHMKVGDRLRLAVVYEVEYFQSYEGEWDAEVCFPRVKVLKRQPWSEKRHGRYLAKSKA